MLKNLILKFYENSPVLNAFLASTFTWFMTALGASFVFFLKKTNEKIMETMLGFAGGVMLAASYWSLLSPALELSKKGTLPSWAPPSIGFIAGAIFLRLLDAFVPHLHILEDENKKEGIKSFFKVNTLLLLAVTLHNIPEGLAVGVAFGALFENSTLATLSGAISLAIGIGIQNIPEGAVISMPLRASGFSKFKSFFYGQLSGFVEPLSAIVGIVFIKTFTKILPYAMGFAAGAMIYVVVEEVIPESQKNENTDLATMSLITGFLLMMILDVALG